MRRGLPTQESYDFRKIISKIKSIDGIDKVKLRAYQDDYRDNNVFVEAYVVINDSVYEKFEGKRGDGETDVAVHLWATEQVFKKLRFAKRNSKVARVLILDPNKIEE